MTETEYLNRIRAICSSHNADKVLLFGSRAKGTNRLNSDFDIAVFGVEDTADIQDEIDELPTLFASDVVNMSRCRNENLIKDILSYGIQI